MCAKKDPVETAEAQPEAQEESSGAESVEEAAVENVAESIAAPESEPDSEPEVVQAVKKPRSEKQQAATKRATEARAKQLRIMQAERDAKRAIEEEERLLAAAERIKQKKAREKKELAAQRKAEREARKPRVTKAKPLQEEEDEEANIQPLKQSAPVPLKKISKRVPKQPLEGGPMPAARLRAQEEEVTVAFTENPFLKPYWR